MQASQAQSQLTVAGKNRPLDEDDLAFVNALVESEQARDQSVREAERSDLESFQAVILDYLDVSTMSFSPGRIIACHLRSIAVLL